MSEEALLDIKNLRVHFDTLYGSVEALNDVNLQVKEGEIRGVVGESGCGKSVTSLTAMGLATCKVDEGSIHYKGYNTVHYEESWESLFGIISFIISSIGALTVMINVGRLIFNTDAIYTVLLGIVIMVSGSVIGIIGRWSRIKHEREMRRIRGNEISMIFQEPMTALNPLYTVEKQISEVMKEHDRLVDRKVSYFQRIPMAIIKPFRLIIESARSNPVSTASPFVLLAIYFAVVNKSMNNQFESISWYLLPLLLVGYYISRLINPNSDNKEYLDALFETLPFLPMAFAFSLMLYLVFWMPTQAVLVILVVLAVISLPWIIISDYLQLDEAHREQVIEILHEVKIPNPEAVVKMYPHELSGGMRQRVMIAMMMACEPKLLIADEPTTALDVTIQAQILKLMRDLREEKGTSILLITHDLGVIAEMCDTVSVMYAGRVVEDASVEEIFANPTHAYTRGLLASSPKLDSDRKSVLPTIPGQVAQPSDFVPGCRFCQRMNRQGETIKIRPEMKEISPGHWVENCPICANSKIDWRVEANV